MYNDEQLREFGWNIQKLIEKQNLSRKVSYAMFREVLADSQPDLQQGAFLSALTAKGETPEEIAGAWQAIVELDTTPIDPAAAEELAAEPLVENSGTGMDQLKTFNVSSAAAVVAAAGGVRLARHGARALTSTCGTVDLLEAVGIDVDCEVDRVTASIRTAGLGLFNGMSPQVHPRSLARILSRIRFGSTLNIAASLASPCRPSHALRGVYARDVIPKVGRVMQAIGYEHALVVHGLDGTGDKGMDEFSTLGETLVQEIFPDGTQRDYTLAPEDCGIARTNYQAIAASGDVPQEALRFIKVMAGADHAECQDLASLNAGAILYLAGRAPDIAQGTATARELIRDGHAFKKLARWVAVQADDQGRGLSRFQALADQAGLGREVRAVV